MDEGKRQEEVKRRIALITDHAEALYDLLDPGMTVEIKIRANVIVAPNKPPQMKKLLITRPAVWLGITGD